MPSRAARTTIAGRAAFFFLIKRAQIARAARAYSRKHFSIYANKYFRRMALSLAADDRTCARRDRRADPAR
jgi:hypothetical protein